MCDPLCQTNFNLRPAPLHSGPCSLWSARRADGPRPPKQCHSTNSLCPRVDLFQILDFPFIYIGYMYTERPNASFKCSRYYSFKMQFTTDSNEYLRDIQQALQSLTAATERCQLTYIGSAGDNVHSLSTREAARRALVLEAYKFLQTSQGPVDAAATCYEQVLSIDSNLSDACTKPS
jgi:hypothetical protein